MACCMEIVTLLLSVVAAPAMETAMETIYEHSAIDRETWELPTCPSTGCSTQSLFSKPSDSTSLIQGSMLLREAMPRRNMPPAVQEEQAETQPEDAVSGETPRNESESSEPSQGIESSLAWDMARLVDNEDEQEAMKVEACQFGMDGNKCANMSPMPKNPFSIGLPNRSMDKVSFAAHQAVPIHQRIEIERSGRGKLGWIHEKPLEELHRYVQLRDIDGQMLNVHEVISTNGTRLQESQFPILLAISEDPDHPIQVDGDIDWEALFDRNELDAKETSKKCEAELGKLNTMWKEDAFYKDLVKTQAEVVRVRGLMVDEMFKAEDMRRKGLWGRQKYLIQNGDVRTKTSNTVLSSKSRTIMVKAGEKEMEKQMHKLIAQRNKAKHGMQANDHKHKYKMKKEECAQAASTVEWLPIIRQRMIGSMEENTVLSELMEEIFDWFGKKKTEEPLVPGSTTEDEGVKLVMDQFTAAKYWELKVRNGLQTAFRVLRGYIMSLVAKELDKVEKLVSHPIVTWVGTAPIVGGVLAVLCTILIKAAFEFMGFIIETVIDLVLDFTLDKLAVVILKPIIAWTSATSYNPDDFKKSSDLPVVAPPGPTPEELQALAIAETERISKEKQKQWKDNLANGGGINEKQAELDISSVASIEGEKFEEADKDVKEDFELPKDEDDKDEENEAIQGEVNARIKEAVGKVSTRHSEGYDPATTHDCWAVLGAGPRTQSIPWPSCKCNGVQTEYWTWAVTCGTMDKHGVEHTLHKESASNGHKMRFDMQKNVIPNLNKCPQGALPACTAKLKDCAKLNPKTC